MVKTYDNGSVINIDKRGGCLAVMSKIASLMQIADGKGYVLRLLKNNCLMHKTNISFLIQETKIECLTQMKR